MTKHEIKPDAVYKSKWNVTESGNKQLHDDTCNYTNDCSSGIGAFGKHAQHEQSSHTTQYEPEYLVEFVPQ